MPTVEQTIILLNVTKKENSLKQSLLPPNDVYKY